MAQEHGSHSRQILGIVVEVFACAFTPYRTKTDMTQSAYKIYPWGDSMQVGFDKVGEISAVDFTCLLMTLLAFDQ